MSKEDVPIVDGIVDRYIQHMKELGAKVIGSKIDIFMDVTATHLNGCPLKLEELLKADNFDFMHDVTGILLNLDRKTGKLRNCFNPRCAK